MVRGVVRISAASMPCRRITKGTPIPGPRRNHPIRGRKTLREELTLSEGSHGDVYRILRIIALVDRRGTSVERPRYRTVLLATVIMTFWCLISGTIVVMAFNASCIETCSLSRPLGHPVKN